MRVHVLKVADYPPSCKILKQMFDLQTHSLQNSLHTGLIDINWIEVNEFLIYFILVWFENI